MSIPWDALGRECAANFRQPLNKTDISASRKLVFTVSNISRECADKPLQCIVFRSSDNDRDICRSVFRWDVTPYEEVFENGFRAMRTEDTSDEIYYSLGLYVHNGRNMRLDSRQHTNHAFISTTLSSLWLPTITPGTWQKVYRYEIFAPGGISMAATLGDRDDNYPGQDEVCFVDGIAPQYIRAVQTFRLTSDHDASSRHIESRRANTHLIVNANFNPLSHPHERSLYLQNPLFKYHDWDIGKDQPLEITIYPATDSNNIIKWYTTTTSDEPESPGGVGNVESYINAAFHSSHDDNQVFIFMKKEYVLLEYAPDEMTNKVLIGPVRIAKGYPSLKNTVFQEGIDCAFGSHDDDEAFIFSGNLCAKINYPSNTKDDKIIKGPVTIVEMFPCLSDFRYIKFQSSVDAAFESSIKHEAYLFKDDQYARINYNNLSIIETGPITQGFECFKGSIFENGIDAAFAMHLANEVCLFKRDSYARFKFAPESGDNHIIGDVQKILDDWIGIAGFFPRKNQGVDENGQI